MAFVNHAGARIHWQALGKGEPLVLLMGLGCSSAMWFRLAPRLAKHYRVILMDNRGAGQTTVENYVVHRVPVMASDVAAVLDAAGADRAHVLGISMGGMIAQEFALNHPERVRSLVLAATNCGGPYATLAQPKVWSLLFSKGARTPEENLHAMRPYTFARKTPQQVIEEDYVVRLASYPVLRGYQAQLYGLMGWSSYSRLPDIACRTLVLHGEEDQLIPPANGRLLAQRIPDAQLVELANASHWIPSDQLDATVNSVKSFLGKPLTARGA